MNTNDQTKRLFLSLPEAARALDIDIRTMRRALEREQIPAIELGGRKLIPRRVIEELVQLAIEVADDATQK